MESLEWVNEQLSFYRNNDYKWVRELTTLYEQYFDKNFRQNLSTADFRENDLRQIFLFSLDTLYMVISQDDNYFGTGEMTFGQTFNYLSHPAMNSENSLNKEKIQKLFIKVTLPFRIFEMNIIENRLQYFKLKHDKANLNKTTKQKIEQRKSTTKEVNKYRPAVYTKTDLLKKADIEIAAALRTFPHPPTLKQLEEESMRQLDKGKVSISVWSRTRKRSSYWKMMIMEINNRLQSNRKLKQDKIEKLIKLRDFLRADLSNMIAREEWKNRKESGDIFDQREAREFKDDNLQYIKIRKSSDIVDNLDDQEAKELGNYT
jgi:hypothetical protein